MKTNTGFREVKTRFLHVSRLMCCPERSPLHAHSQCRSSYATQVIFDLFLKHIRCIYFTCEYTFAVVLGGLSSPLSSSSVVLSILVFSYYIKKKQ